MRLLILVIPYIPICLKPPETNPIISCDLTPTNYAQSDTLQVKSTISEALC